MSDGTGDSGGAVFVIGTCAAACILYGLVILFTGETYIWQMESPTVFGGFRWVVGPFFILAGFAIWFTPKRIVAALREKQLRNRILGAIGILWGSTVLVGGFLTDRFQLATEGHFRAGELAGAAFAIGLILAGAWALMRRS